jgi:threonine aldolase
MTTQPSDAESTPTEPASPESTPTEPASPEPWRRRVDSRRNAHRVLSAIRAAPLRELMTDLATSAEQVHDLSDYPDVYGDGVVRTLEQRVATLLGTEDAAYFPSGTMAQQVALRCWAGRTGNPTVAMHPLAHPEVHERHAYAQLTGLRSVWPTTTPRIPTAAEVHDTPEPFGTLMLELPLRDAGYVLPTWTELTEVVAAAREREAVVHFDGARLWETELHFGHPLREIAELADSVYVSFYKSLGAISGAALAGSQQFIDETRTWRHRYGGQIFQQWPAALSALTGLDRELPRLPDYVRKARTVAAALATALSQLPGAHVFPNPPHTHQFRLWMPYPPEQLEEVGITMAEQTGTSLFGYWEPAGSPDTSFTELTIAASAATWTDKEVETAITDFLHRLRA